MMTQGNTVSFETIGITNLQKSINANIFYRFGLYVLLFLCLCYVDRRQLYDPDNIFYACTLVFLLSTIGFNPFICCYIFAFVQCIRTTAFIVWMLRFVDMHWWFKWNDVGRLTLYSLGYFYILLFFALVASVLRLIIMSKYNMTIRNMWMQHLWYASVLPVLILSWWLSIWLCGSRLANLFTFYESIIYRPIGI